MPPMGPTNYGASPGGMSSQMPQQLPPMLQMPPQPVGGGSGDQTCPTCGQPLPMPFNTANSPNEPMPQQELQGQGSGQGQPNPEELQMLLQMLGGGGMR